MYDYFQSAFLGAVRQATADQLDWSTLELRVTERHAELVEQHADWVCHPPDEFNLKMTALVLATYRALESHLTAEDALQKVRYAFVECDRQQALQATAAQLDQAADPFRMMVETSKQVEEHKYGPSFSFERQQDDQQVYLLNVKRCLYHRFFQANQAPELTAVFCAYDANWSDAIDPAKHGFRFERPTTLGHGDDMCRFQFYRIDKEKTEKR